jgi:hypothetical protein
MAAAVGWRNFWWLNTALLGFTVVCCIFLFPETKFNRNFAPSHSLVSSSPQLKPGSSEQLEGSPAQNGSGTVATDHADPEKDAPVQAQQPLAMDGSEKLAHVHTHQDPWLGRGKPSKAQWKIAQPYSFHGSFAFSPSWSTQLSSYHGPLLRFLLLILLKIKLLLHLHTTSHQPRLDFSTSLF